MLSPCRTSVAAASLLIATAVFAFSATDSKAQGRSGACEESNLAVLASPLAPWKGAPLRVVFTSEKPLDGELSLVAPDGSVAAKSRKRFGGPPYFWFAEVNAPAAGKWRASLASPDCGNVAREISVRSDQPPRPQTAAG
ncbi:MAG TPA: hypothetical protein VFV87_16040, partial [Pirellulaceae bacterium]|nr:hypothetical protein [Pirellulaceae bacterium]